MMSQSVSLSLRDDVDRSPQDQGEQILAMGGESRKGNAGRSMFYLQQ